MSEQRVSRYGKTYPAILNYFRDNPGATAKRAYGELKKTEPDVAAISFAAFSGGISNMVNTGRLFYRPHVSVAGDRSLYGVHFKSMNISKKRIIFGHGKRRFRRSKREMNHGTGVGTPAIPTKVVKANGAKVDVQLMIAIGDRDTLVGFAVARELYLQLKGIFESE